MAAVYQLDYDLDRVQVLNAIPFAFPVMRARREHFRKEAVQRMFRTPSSNNAISVSKWRNCCNYSSQPSYFTRNATKMSRSACVTSHCCQENLELLREKMFSQSVVAFLSSSCFVFFINIKLNKNLSRLFLILKTLIFKIFRIQFNAVFALVYLFNRELCNLANYWNISSRTISFPCLKNTRRKRFSSRFDYYLSQKNRLSIEARFPSQPWYDRD